MNAVIMQNSIDCFEESFDKARNLKNLLQNKHNAAEIKLIFEVIALMDDGLYLLRLQQKSMIDLTSFSNQQI